MVNKNYVRGRNYEYRIMKKLRNESYQVLIRSAGSHSPVDIVALDIINKRIKLVQCKLKNSDKREAELKLSEFKGTFEVESIVV